MRAIMVKFGSSLLVTLALGACLGASPAKPAGSDSGSGPSAQPMPGGYVSQDPQSETIQSVAAKAVELLRTRQNDPAITLTQVLKAASQVVAGANFQLTLALQTAEGPKTVDVTVYRDLQDHYSLTRVEGL